MVNVEVFPLTSQLAYRLEYAATKALNGDKCNLEDVKKSCFASETCGKTSMKLRELMNHEYAFVAVDENNPLEFVGCVSCNTGRTDRMVAKMFPNAQLHKDSIVIYNLCISYKYRGNKIASKLMNEVCKICCNPGRCHLLIARKNTYFDTIIGIPGEIEKRVKKLKSMYEYMKFREFGKTEDVILMRR